MPKIVFSKNKTTSSGSEWGSGKDGMIISVLRKREPKHANEALPEVRWAAKKVGQRGTQNIGAKSKDTQCNSGFPGAGQFRIRFGHVILRCGAIKILTRLSSAKYVLVLTWQKHLDVGAMAPLHNY